MSITAVSHRPARPSESSRARAPSITCARSARMPRMAWIPLQDAREHATVPTRDVHEYVDPAEVVGVQHRRQHHLAEGDHRLVEGAPRVADRGRDTRRRARRAWLRRRVRPFSPNASCRRRRGSERDRTSRAPSRTGVPGASRSAAAAGVSANVRGAVSRKTPTRRERAQDAVQRVLLDARARAISAAVVAPAAMWSATLS